MQCQRRVAELANACHVARHGSDWKHTMMVLSEMITWYATYSRWPLVYSGQSASKKTCPSKPSTIFGKLSSSV
jgi:hypothetical protein